MGINIVTNDFVVSRLSKSRYFVKNLGLVQTVEKGPGRVYNNKDKFNHFYSTRYNTTIFGKGNVGDMKFYTDLYINTNTMAVYYGETFEEFLFEYDSEIMREKGPDGYLGYILMECDKRYEELVKNNELKKIETKRKGNPNALLENPGMVSYEDVLAYMELKRSGKI